VIRFFILFEMLKGSVSKSFCFVAYREKTTLLCTENDLSELNVMLLSLCLSDCFRNSLLIPCCSLSEYLFLVRLFDSIEIFLEISCLFNSVTNLL
jgi:hypothetical protein